MRFIIFLLGVLGSLLMAACGWFWLDHQLRWQLVEQFDLEHLARQHEEVWYIMPDYDFDTQAMFGAALFLLVGAALGLLGSLLVLVRRGRQAAVLMIVGALGPVIFKPIAIAFTGLLALTALLSLAVRPLPPPAVREEP
jgi:hypothetical protein